VEQRKPQVPLELLWVSEPLLMSYRATALELAEPDRRESVVKEPVEGLLALSFVEKFPPKVPKV
jgi:hypothetical protein